jgi:SAM-dependent methyltransferase
VVGLAGSAARRARPPPKLRPDWQARFVVGDVRKMDFPDAYFDATVVSKLFQHVPAWQRAVDEIHRVTKPGGYLLHINEKGAFQNAVRRRFAEECDRRGRRDRYDGLRDRSQLATYVQQVGGSPVPLDVRDLSWNKDVAYGEAFEHLRRRLHSEFWSIPDDEYAAILDAVAGWISEQPQGVDTVEHMTPYLTAEVFRWDRSAGS